MPCTGTPISTPSISCLDYLLAWDISGAQPIVTITNNSTVSAASSLKWWFYVESPSGQAIYGANLAGLSVLPAPDVSGVAWTTKIVNLPTPFGNAPCGQIEFSPNGPYTVIVFVQDQAVTLVSPTGYTKTTIIVRPTGNNDKVCGNFGRAVVGMKVDCLNQLIQCINNTTLTYNSILKPIVTSNLWTLVYPQAPDGSIPNRTATDVPSVNFPASINSKAYTLYLQEFATYDYGNGITVKVQYKLLNGSGGLGQTFAISCNTNLCQLQCQMQKFYELSKSKCGVLENADLLNKMTRMNWIFNEIITGILQPLCGIDVAALMDEMKDIGNFDDNCDCGCFGNDLGFSNPNNTGGGSGCCPSYSNVVDVATGNPPTACPGSYFPVQVEGPIVTSPATIIGTAYNINDLVGLLNASPAWQVYGVAFAAGNCKVGWFPANASQVIPVIPVIIISGIIIPTTTTGNIVIHGTTTPPPPCPRDYFPVKVYNEPGTAIIGIANNILELVNIVNADSTWNSIATAAPLGNCNVTWTLKDATVIPPDIQVDTNTGGTGCINNSTMYTLVITDPCIGSRFLVSTDFPCHCYVNFGLGAGVIDLGFITSWANLIVAYNAASGKPASITFSAGSIVGQVIVTNTNCTAYSGTPVLTADLGSLNFMMYGANHSQMIAAPPGVCAEQGVGVKSGSVIGKISGAAPAGITTDEPPWHTIIIGKYMLVTSPVTVIYEVRMYDISNPLVPVFIRSVNLPATTSPVTNFAGTPHVPTVASGETPIRSAFDLYFPTDNPGDMSINAVYVMESNTGSIWKLDMLAVGSAVVSSFLDQRLRGKCPRVITNNYIYFTQDGDMETSGGLPSSILPAYIVKLDLSTFSSGGLSSQAIFFLPSVEYIYAATFDGSDTIWFAGVSGTLARYSVSADATLNVYANALPVCAYRLNIKFFINWIFASSLSFTGLTTGTVVLTATALPTVTRVNFQNFTPPGSVVANNASHYNSLPLGNCLVAVTYDNWADTAHPAGGVAIFRIDGALVEIIPLAAGNIYNVAPISNVSVYTPTSLV